MAAKSRTARYYASNPKARAKKKKYDTTYGSTAERKEYRKKLARARRKRGSWARVAATLAIRKEADSSERLHLRTALVRVQTKNLPKSNHGS